MEFEKLNNDIKNEKIWFEGQGSSFEDSVVIFGAHTTTMGVAAEKIYISSRFGRENSDWFFKTQKLFIIDGKAFDLITFSLADGSIKQLYFNISEFYGKRTLAG